MFKGPSNSAKYQSGGHEEFPNEYIPYGQYITYEEMQEQAAAELQDMQEQAAAELQDVVRSHYASKLQPLRNFVMHDAVEVRELIRSKTLDFGYQQHINSNNLVKDNKSTEAHSVDTQKKQARNP